MSRWVVQYLYTGDVERKISSRVAYNVYQVYIDFILNYLQNHKTVSTPELLVSLKERFPDVDLSVRRLYRVVRQNNFTRKRTRHGHFPKTRYKQPVTSKKILEWEFYPEGAMNTDRFLSFLQKIIFNHHIRNHLFIVDNAGAHKNSRVRQLIESFGNHLLYCVPYNPQISAI